MNRILIASSLVVFTGMAHAGPITQRDCKKIKRVVQNSELLYTKYETAKLRKMLKGLTPQFYSYNHIKQARSWHEKSHLYAFGLNQLSDYYLDNCDKSVPSSYTKTVTMTVTKTKEVDKIVTKYKAYTVTIKEPKTQTVAVRVTNHKTSTVYAKSTTTIQQFIQVTSKVSVETPIAASVVGASLLLLLGMGVAVCRAQYKYNTKKEELADALSRLKIEEDKHENDIKALEAQLSAMSEGCKVNERVYNESVAKLEKQFNEALNGKINQRVELLNEINILKDALNVIKEQRTKVELELNEYKKLDGEMKEFQQDKQKIIDGYESQIRILEASNPNAHNINNFTEMCRKQGLTMQQGERNQAQDLPGIYMHMLNNGKAYVGMAKTQSLKRRWDCGKNVDDELNNYNSEFTADMWKFGGPQHVRTIWAYVPMDWDKNVVEIIESSLIKAGDYTNTGYNRKR